MPIHACHFAAFFIKVGVEKAHSKQAPKERRRKNDTKRQVSSKIRFPHGRE
jgi:hypothetical protein